ncbi:MAG TPA: major capsid protein [Acidimicrobiales bacterium]|nr:major capsid protein [Acidimicrobiales bacterium]
MTLTAEQLEAKMDLLLETYATVEEVDRARASGALTASGAARGDTAGGMVGRMATATGPASPSPSAGRSPSAVSITAASASRNVVAGSPLTSSAELGEVMSEALRALAPTGSPEPRRRLVAMAKWDYPEDRQLGDDAETNTRRIEDVCGLNSGRFDRSGALVATGGICLPVNVDYAVPTWSTADRPLRDGLPAFQATRGGVRFTTPPDVGVSSLQGTASGAGTSVGIWTEATDAAPGGATKPVWVVACGTEELVYVNAIPTRVQFGNMSARFAPEQVAANTQQAIAISAREAELELLTLMANSSKQVLAAQYLGATRDLLSSVDLLVSGYRYSHRIPENASMTAVFPEWAKGVIRADLAREIGHDNAGTVNVLAITDPQIEAWFNVRGVNVIWTHDALKAGTYGTGGHAITDQWFPVATAGAEAQWPGQASNAAFVLAWFLFVEGTYQFLDGGRLDLGVVRDSLLDSQNDYETFVETFESLAFRGLECYQAQSTILPNGGSAGTIAPSGYVE